VLPFRTTATAENKERIALIWLWLTSSDLSAATMYTTDKQPVFHGEDEGCPTSIYGFIK